MKVEKIREAFKENGYVYVENIIGEEIARLLCEHSFSCFEKLKDVKNNYDKSTLEKIGNLYGASFDDRQVPGNFTIYNDQFVEVIHHDLMKKVEDIVRTRLIPTYSFIRHYVKGERLKKHYDRESCEISLTIFLGGDERAPWPISMDNEEIFMKKLSGVVYRGPQIMHSRDELPAGWQCQLLLHYNDVNGPYGFENIYDKRRDKRYQYDDAVLDFLS